MIGNGDLPERRNRQKRPDADEFVIVDSDEDCALVEGEGRHRAGAAAAACIDLLDSDDSEAEEDDCAKKSTRRKPSSPIADVAGRGRAKRPSATAGAAGAPCVDMFMLESDDSDVENHNHENRSRRDRVRKKPRRNEASSSAAAEAADRELAQRLQREEDSLAGAHRGRWERRRGGAVPSQTSIASSIGVNSGKRKEERRLREAQDREYQQTLLADQIKDIDRREAEERERRVESEREEAESLEKAKEASALEDARARVERAGAEPPDGSEGVTRLRFALPSGSKVDRRFHSTDTIKTIQAFLTVYFNKKGINIRNFELSTNFPKRNFGEADGHLTLEKAGLAPQALVMVIDQDS